MFAPLRLVTLPALVLIGLGMAVSRGGGAQGTSGPDVIVGDLPDVANWGGQGDELAFSFATVSCNVGDVALDWLPDPDSNHPVIAQNLHRVTRERIEQVGLSWLKHGFAVVPSSVCAACTDPAGDRLGVGCSDLYSATLNGFQNRLGPRSEVNAFTGAFKLPFTHLPSGIGPLEGRVRVRRSDLDPALNPGAKYVAEAEYVHPQDAAARNGANNASYRVVAVDPASLQLHFNPSEPVHRTEPAVNAWGALSDGVRLQTLAVPGDGRFVVGVRVSRPAGGAGFHTEIAVENINSDRGAGSLEVTLAGTGGTTSNPGFHGVRYDHEPYSPADWSANPGGGSVKWSARPFNESSNANALRWSTLYNVWFDSTEPPSTLTLGLFKPGTPDSVRLDITPAVIAPTPPPGPAAPSPPEAGQRPWLAGPTDVHLDRIGAGDRAATFRVYQTPGADADLAGVDVPSKSLTVSTKPVREGGRSGWEVRVERAGAAPEGGVETGLTFRSTRKYDMPFRVRAYGEISRRTE